MRSVKPEYKLGNINESVDYSSNTLSRIKNNKILLYIILSLMLIVDIYMLVTLSTKGVSVGIITAICVLTFDVLFLAASVMTNYKFKRSYLVLAVYLVSTIWTVSTFSIVLSANNNIMTNFASTLSLVCIVVLRVSVIMCILSAFGKTAKSRNSIALVALAMVFCVSCTMVLFQEVQGFNGQGNTYKDTYADIEYKYDDDAGYYIANGLASEGNLVTIPETFNNVAVGEVSYAIIGSSQLDAIYIENTIDLLVVPALGSSSCSIYVDYGIIDDYRQYYYDLWLDGDMESTISEKMTLNRLEPSGLADDAVYVTFAYGSVSDYEESMGDVVPTWIGSVGEKFDLSYYEDTCYYMYHADSSIEGNLAWSYENYDGYILDELVDSNGMALDGQVINQSIVGVQLSTQPILQLVYNDGNDSMYSMPAEFDSVVYEGITYSNRYVLASDFATVEDTLPERDGLTATWSADFTTNYTESSSVSIAPTWSVDAPVSNIALSTDAVANTITYGDDIQLSIDTTGYSGLSLYYQLVDASGNIVETYSPTSEWTLSQYGVAESGTCFVYVYATDSSVTSLKSSVVTYSVGITIEKYALEFDWTVPVEQTYDTLDKSISAVCTSTPVGDDVIDYTLSLDSVVNAGTYSPYIILDSAVSANYYIESASYSSTFVIAQAGLTITATDADKTYDGNSYTAFEYTCSDLAGSDIITDVISAISYGDSATNAVDANTYTIIPTCSSTGSLYSNYDITWVNADLVINQANVTAVWSSTATVYNGYAQSAVATAEGVGSDGTLTFSVTSFTDAGSYTAEVIPTYNNYNVLNDSQSFAIATASLTIKATDVEKTYNSAIYTYSAFAYSYSGLVGSDTIAEVIATVSYSGTAVDAINADSGYVITPSCETEGSKYANYSISWEDGSMAIAQASLTITATTVSKTYDGAVYSDFTYSCSGLAGSDDIEDVLTVVSYSGTATTATDVGNDYIITPSCGTAGNLYDNYSITWTTNTLTITPASLTITATSDSKTYDGAVYSGYAYSYEGIVGGDSIQDAVASVSYGGTSVTATNVGTYTITPGCETEGSKFGNYTITWIAGSLEISPAEVAVSWSNTTVEYNGSAQSAVATASGVGSDGTLILSVTSFTNAGDYTATASTTNANYSLSVDTYTHDFTITTASLTITATDASKTYDGAVYSSFAYSYSGLVGNDTILDAVVSVSYSGTATTATDAGNGYVITPSCGIAGSKYSNYSISWQDGELIINQASLTITATTASKTYDGAVYSDFTYSYSVLAGSDSIEDVLTVVSYSGTALDAINAGSGYVITPSCGTEGSKYDNYSITWQDGELTINQASLTITATSDSKTYDGAVYSGYAYSCSGLVEGDTIEQVVSMMSYGGTAIGVTNAGTYTITPSCGTAGSKYDNYSITWQDGELTIDKADTVINTTGVTTSYTYTGEEQSVITGATINHSESSVVYSDNTFTNADTYTVAISVSESTNYNGASTTVEVSVAQATNSITGLAIAGWTYGDTANTATSSSSFGTIAYTYSTAIDGTYSDTVPTAAGTYYMKATVAETTNYAGATATTSFVIAKATYTGITHDEVSATYTTTLTLADVNLNSGYSWKTESTSLVAGTSSYSAIYNADSYNYNDFELTVSVVVAKATNSITGLAIIGWTYGDTANTPTATAEFGTITYTYYSDVDCQTVVSDISNVNAGTYYVKATVAEATNYEGATATTSFVIAKATYTGITHDEVSATYTTTLTLADVNLNSGYSWKTESTSLVAGTASYSAIYNADSDNYNNFELTISVAVAKATVAEPIAASGLEYNGNEQTGLASTAAYTVEGGTATEAGTHIATVTLVDSDNYMWANGTEVTTVEYTIAEQVDA